MRALALLLTLAACAEPLPEEPVVAESSGTENPAEPSVIEPAEPPALTAEAQAETAEGAEAALRAMVRERVLGPWGREAPVELLEPGAIEVTTVEGELRARVEMGEAALRALVRSLPERLPRPAFDGPFEVVRPLQEAAIANFICQRRRALFEDQCELIDLEEAVRLSAEALRPLHLEPMWAGGVPVNGEGQPLRKPAVQLRLGADPARGLAGLPIVATPAEGDSLRVAADGQGVALLNMTPGDGLVAALDRSGLVPPLDAIFPELRAPLRPRPVSLRQWALVSDRADGPFAEALDGALQAGGAERRVTLARGRGRALKGSRGSRRAATLRALANEQGGALDVVLIAHVESHFASRMGSRRTWYEAEAEVEAFLAWTGESLGRFEARGNESGIGDERAEAAARAKVARDLARQLVAAPALGLARQPTAAIDVTLAAR